MKTRILAAIPIVVLLIVSLIFQSWLLFSVIVALSIIAQHEINAALSAKETKVISPVTYIMCGVVPFLLIASRLCIYVTDVFFLLFIIYAVMLIIIFIVAMFGKQYDYKSFRNTVIAMIYPMVFFIFMYLVVLDFTNMQWIGTNPVVLLLCILPTVFSDTLAYFVGRALGKRKLCPEISPKKTVAGAIGGIAGGVIAGVLIWLFFISGITGLTFDMSAWLCIVISAVVAFVSQFGDLSASFIKRYYGIKDYGKLIPGHGGVLDRVDSWLFAFPTVYIILVAIGYLI